MSVSINDLGESLQTGYLAWLAQLRLPIVATPRDWEVFAHLQTDAAQAIADIQGWIAFDSWLTSGFFPAPTGGIPPAPGSETDHAAAFVADAPAVSSPFHSPASPVHSPTSPAFTPALAANVTQTSNPRLPQPDERMDNSLDSPPGQSPVSSRFPAPEPAPRAPASPAPVGGLRDLAKIAAGPGVALPTEPTKAEARSDISHLPTGQATYAAPAAGLPHVEGVELRSPKNGKDSTPLYEMNQVERDVILPTPAAHDMRLEMPESEFGETRWSGQGINQVPSPPATESLVDVGQMDNLSRENGQAESLPYRDLAKMALEMTGKAQKESPLLETESRPGWPEILRVLSGPRLATNPLAAPAGTIQAANLPLETARQAAAGLNPLGEIPEIMRRMVETEPAAGPGSPNFSELEVQDLLDALKREAWREYERFYGPVR